jgi:hypothetical protein
LFKMRAGHANALGAAAAGGLRDRDRDGVPNRYDCDNDGVRNRHDSRPNNLNRY